MQGTPFGREMTGYRVDDLVRQAEAERASRPIRKARSAERRATVSGFASALASLVLRPIARRQPSAHWRTARRHVV